MNARGRRRRRLRRLQLDLRHVDGEGDFRLERVEPPAVEVCAESLGVPDAAKLEEERVGALPRAVAHEAHMPDVPGRVREAWWDRVPPQQQGVG